MGNIHVKLYEIWSSGSGGGGGGGGKISFKDISYLEVQAAVLFSGAELFVQFW